WYLPVSAELPASLLDTLLHKLNTSGKAQGVTKAQD
ncbi:MAG: tetraacyldisaccharide 4'-kinase, partial [Aeromonas veronii]